MSAGRVDMKVVLLGKEYTGKTCLADRFLHQRFSGITRYQSTIGAAFGAKRLVINGKPVVMGIWDTAGSERYEAMSRIYYRGAKAALVCYDLADKSSFQRVQFWVKELQKSEHDCKIYLCGTKKDIIDANPTARQVDYHDVRNFADEINAQVFETSSKTGENIDKLFNKIAEDYAEDCRQPKPIAPDVTIKLEEKPKSSCRC